MAKKKKNAPATVTESSPTAPDAVVESAPSSAEDVASSASATESVPPLQEATSEVASAGTNSAGNGGVAAEDVVAGTATTSDHVASNPVAEGEPSVDTAAVAAAMTDVLGNGDRPPVKDKGPAGGSPDVGAAEEPAVAGKEEPKAAAGAVEFDDDLPLYPMPVKGPGGEELELQVNPGDTVMDLRQFLADAPETCFYTCFELILTVKDGTRYHLVDFIEIGEVTDVAGGGCSLEMLAAFYDDRQIRFHVRKTRELLSTAGLYTSPATTWNNEYEAQQALLEEGKALPSRKVPTELENLGFADSAAGLLGKLGPKPAEEKNTCMESVAFSSFNPVPGYRRLQGDIMYLDLITLEGEQFPVTAHTRGFCVNSSNGRILKPMPTEPKKEASTLVGLLRLLSPKFNDEFVAVTEKKAAGHPFENMAPSLPVNYWLGPHPVPDHTASVARAEDALMSPFGTEVSGLHRDWNEELQSCRELPRVSSQDRIVRDRALYRVTTEFVDAAIKGARAVIGRSIPPMNAPDPDKYHMYVHNSIFFSLAVDADFVALQQIREEDLTRQAKEAEEAKKKEEGTHEPEAVGEAAAGQEGEGTSEIGKDEQKQVIAQEEPASGPAAANTDQGKTELDENSSAFAGVPAASAEFVDKESSGEADSQGGNDATTADNGKKQDESAEGRPAPETEQATYASANNDLKGTKVLNVADVPGLHSLALAIVDYRGHRVVAQSIIPGILYGDKTSSLLYGSVDNGKHIKWDEKFHEKVREVGQILHLKEHEVEDPEGKTVKLCSPVECKGIIGSDDRKYFLDLMRLMPRDVNFMGPGTRLTVLRPELVDAFCKVEEVQRYMKESGKTERPSEQEIRELREAGSLPRVLFNPNVFTDFKVAGDAELLSEDEALVRRAGKWLVDTAIPSLVADFQSVEVSPMDGFTLTAAFHSHGVNMRYLAKVAEAAKDLPHIWHLCLQEMVVRSCKHVLKAVLRETFDHDVGGAIAHFFNCFLGTFEDPSVPPQTLSREEAGLETKTTAEETGKSAAEGEAKVGEAGTSEEVGSTSVEDKATAMDGVGEKKDGEGLAGAEEEKKEGEEEQPVGYLRITADMVWSDIFEGVKYKYKYELPKDIRDSMREISTLRNICLKMGIVMAARDFDFTTQIPFEVSDIQDMLPVVKHAAPMSGLALDLMTKGKRSLQEIGLPVESKLCGFPQLSTSLLRKDEGKLNDAFEAYSEAFNTLQQIYGPLHKAVANCCRHLAMVQYHAGDPGSALQQQHRELVINEKLLGMDHPDTAHSYGNMALFYHALGESELALRHMARTLDLFGVTCGANHPDTAAIFINVAMVYQDAGKIQMALRYLQEALKCNEKLLGGDHVQTAVCHHALALAFSAMGAFKLSLQQERKAHGILEKHLGKDDPRTKDSYHWIDQFLKREVQLERQKRQTALLTAEQQASAARFAEILKARPDLMEALQKANGNSEVIQRIMQEAFRKEGGMPHQRHVNAAPQTTPGLRSRGLDERAAKAAQEARKKAAARGVPLRGSGIPAARVGGGAPSVDHDDAASAFGGNQSRASSSRVASSVPTPAPTSASSAASAAAASTSANLKPAMGAGLGVGLGAIAGAAPPTKSRKAAGGGPLASPNGTAEEKAPKGLGGGLGGLGLDPPKKVGKAKGKKAQSSQAA